MTDETANLRPEHIRGDMARRTKDDMTGTPRVPAERIGRRPDPGH